MVIKFINLAIICSFGYLVMLNALNGGALLNIM